tara:strand:- start:371 stop:592 length:222 start_codon:yes stop_codon:yes gene_type:complete
LGYFFGSRARVSEEKIANGIVYYASPCPECEIGGRKSDYGSIETIEEAYGGVPIDKWPPEVRREYRKLKKNGR